MRFVILILFCAFFLVPQPAYSNEAAHIFTNPMKIGNSADPGVLRVGDKLYVYSSGCSRGIGAAMPIEVTDFDERTTWTRVGAIFTSETLPLWSARSCRYWAPEVFRVQNRYICYFSAVDENNRFCIGAAISDSPVGPFLDVGKPIVSNPGWGLIDPSYFTDPISGRTYLMWKEDKNGLDPKQPTDMFIQEISADGLALRGKPVFLLTNDTEWEEDLVEAPSIIYRKGYYYCFFSANAFHDSRYAVGVARSRKVTGPYVKYEKNPILKSNDLFDGPGHQFLYEEKPGVWTMFYHARYGPNQSRRRHLMSDPVKWSDDGWPYIDGGTPSLEWNRETHVTVKPTTATIDALRVPPDTQSTSSEIEDVQ